MPSISARPQLVPDLNGRVQERFGIDVLPFAFKEGRDEQRGIAIVILAGLNRKSLQAR